MKISSERQFGFSGGHSLGVDLSPQPFQLTSVGKTIDRALNFINKIVVNSSNQ